jgi:hypothetical protein
MALVSPSQVRQFRRRYTDRLLTLLAILLAIEMFVIAPLQAMGIFVFQSFAVVALLGILGSMILISDHIAALTVMSVAFTANVVVFLERLFYPPWPYNAYLLAAAWLDRSHTRSGRRASRI